MSFIVKETKFVQVHGWTNEIHNFFYHVFQVSSLLFTIDSQVMHIHQWGSQSEYQQQQIYKTGQIEPFPEDNLDARNTNRVENKTSKCPKQMNFGGESYFNQIQISMKNRIYPCLVMIMKIQH